MHRCIVRYIVCASTKLDLHSFPTRRSSDLSRIANGVATKVAARMTACPPRYHRPPRTRSPVGVGARGAAGAAVEPTRSEEHTSELQSPCNLVCRLLLEKKNRLRYYSRRIMD